MGVGSRGSDTAELCGPAGVKLPRNSWARVSGRNAFGMVISFASEFRWARCGAVAVALLESGGLAAAAIQSPGFGAAEKGRVLVQP